MEEKMKYLDLIQGIITRMANNSFMLKGWAVTLLVGVLALSSIDWIAFVPILAFWGLDSYYLLQERLYRSLYSRAIKIKNEDVDFRLSISETERAGSKNTFISCFFSNTELFFYLPMVVLLAVLIIR